MSDEQDKLQRQLEQATAGENRPDTPLDAETASMREAWLALGQLLEAAQPAVDEPLRLRPMPRRAVHTRWRLAGMAALAAGLVVAVTLAWKFVGTNRPVGPVPSGGELAAASNGKPALVAAQSEQSENKPADDGLDWNGSLDEQLALAGQEIVRVEQDWYQLDDAVGPILRGIEQMEKDIEDNVL